MAPEAEPAVVPPVEVMRLKVAEQVQRAWLPLKIYPISAGVKGGLAGGVAMALIAMLYGLISHGSIWYPINLLAGSLYAPSAMPSVEEMLHFQLSMVSLRARHSPGNCRCWSVFCTAPCCPCFPIAQSCWAESLRPLLWTGLLYHIIGFVNPLLDERINWWWFAVSQVAFGIVAGLVVVRQNKVWTSENLPLAMRAGIEAPGIMHERDGEDRKQ